MIILKNEKATEEEFKSLLNDTKECLEGVLKENESYYLSGSGVEFENDVFESMSKRSKGTLFDGKIEKISGQKFPDIIADKYYGVEVKTSGTGNWKSIGNSVLESSRIDGIERIYLFYGKLSGPVEFKYRKYEDCLYEVAVTHSPGYLIDMNLKEGDTIFDKMGKEYDKLRIESNPIKYIIDYYKKLRPGNELWWMDNEQTSNIIITQWQDLSADDKKMRKIEALALFPELFSEGSKKYLRLSLWLMLKRSVISSSLRDIFSAGGQVERICNGSKKKLPRICAHLSDNINDIKSFIGKSDNEIELSRYWGKDVCGKDKREKLKLWGELMINESLIKSRYEGDFFTTPVDD